MVHSKIRIAKWKWLVWNTMTQLFVGSHILALMVYYYNKRVHQRFFLCAPPLILSQIPMILVSKNASVLKIMLVKTMLPTFAGSFIIFGFTKTMAKNIGAVKDKKKE